MPNQLDAGIGNRQPFSMEVIGKRARAQTDVWVSLSKSW